MLSNTPIERVYLACGITDLRKSIDGLSVIVQECFDLDPFSPSLLVFCNRKRDKLKILHWYNNGFWLYYRSLVQVIFYWPSFHNGTSILVRTLYTLLLLDDFLLVLIQQHIELMAAI